MTFLLPAPAPDPRGTIFADANGRKRWSNTGELLVPDLEVAADPASIVTIQHADGSVRGYRKNDPALDAAINAGGFPVTLGVQGGSLEDLGLTTRSEGAVEEEILDAATALARLDDIATSFDPEFLTYGSRTEHWLLSQIEQFGYDLPEDAKKALSDKATFKTQIINNLNRYISSISGAEVPPKEVERLRGGIPNENDSATEFQAKFDALVLDLRGVVERNMAVRDEGLPSSETALTPTIETAADTPGATTGGGGIGSVVDSAIGSITGTETAATPTEGSGGVLGALSGTAHAAEPVDPAAHWQTRNWTPV